MKSLSDVVYIMSVPKRTWPQKLKFIGIWQAVKNKIICVENLGKMSASNHVGSRCYFFAFLITISQFVEICRLSKSTYSDVHNLLWISKKNDLIVEKSLILELCWQKTVGIISGLFGDAKSGLMHSCLAVNKKKFFKNW